MSSMGSATRSSHATNSNSTTRANANAPSVAVLDQPELGASIRPYTSATIPTIDNNAPTGSSAASSGSRDFGTRNAPATSATRMIGTFTRNTEPNQKWPSRYPLASGPRAPAAPVTLAQIAMAFGRSCAGKVLTMMESVAGMINAAAAPITQRDKMSSV